MQIGQRMVGRFAVRTQHGVLRSVFDVLGSPYELTRKSSQSALIAELQGQGVEKLAHFI